MKRYIIVAIVILTAIILSITVSAADIMKRTDSLNITYEEKSKLNLQNTDAQIVKRYVTGFCFIFPGTNTVDELIQSEEILSKEYLAVESNHIVSYYRVLRDDKVSKIYNISSFERATDEDLIAKMNAGKKLLTILSTDIEIYSCNYFVDKTNLGACIYYETNMGDYVYYRGVAFANNGQYLFPAKDFVELITLIHTARSENADKDGGSVDINDYMDVSKYDMNSPSFGFEVNNSVMNKGNNDVVDKAKRDTIFDNKFVVCGVFSAIGVALLLMIAVISKCIRNASRRKND